MCRLRFRAKQQLTVLELRCRRLTEPLLLHNSPGEHAQITCQSAGTSETYNQAWCRKGDCARDGSRGRAVHCERPRANQDICCPQSSGAASPGRLCRRALASLTRPGALRLLHSETLSSQSASMLCAAQSLVLRRRHSASNPYVRNGAADSNATRAGLRTNLVQHQYRLLSSRAHASQRSGVVSSMYVTCTRRSSNCQLLKWRFRIRMIVHGATAACA